jgi:hypothetical protein
MNVRDNKKNYQGTATTPVNLLVQRGGSSITNLGNTSVPTLTRKTPQVEFYEGNFSKDVTGFQV